jgi:hypothetical protein
MSYFIKRGNTFSISAKEALDIHDRLPGGNYIVQETPEGSLYLEMIESFTLPKKMYGNMEKRAQRMFDTFQNRPNSTGVMLNGEKGSGKTQMAKLLAVMCEQQDIPCIVINAPWRGDAFNKFLQNIEQPCMILFDEFEKVYNRDQQPEVLTLLDGVFPSRKLFVLTCNDKYRIDSHMRNRPGRIFYLLDFEGLEADFVREYCQDNLVNKSYLENVVTISGVFTQFNFDMLKAMVEEMNRYDESPQEALEMLNIKPEFSDNKKFNVRLNVKGKKITLSEYDKWNGNPLNSEGVSVHYYEIDRKGEERFMTYEFSVADLKQVLPQQGKFVFSDGEADLVLERDVKEMFRYDAL